MADRLHELVAPDASVERLRTGFEFLEGPLWNAEGEFLLFSDIPAARIHRWTRSGVVATYRSRSDMSNGLAYDWEGRLLACEHATSRVTRAGRGGELEVVASHYDGKELNSPNDLCVARDGSILFTDPAYGRREPHGVPRDQELGFQGVYRVPPRGGGPELLLDDFEAPNGICLSPDQRTLYVGDSRRMHVRAFDWDGERPASGRVLVDVPNPDGVKCDERGNLWVASGEGVWVASPAGEHLGTVPVDERPANLAFGGESLRELFVCARTSLYRLPTLVAGSRLPPVR
jgi:gluconolactonase